MPGLHPDMLPSHRSNPECCQVGLREYARYLSFHFPFTHERSLLEHLRALPWRLDHDMFKVRPAGACGSVPQGPL